MYSLAFVSAESALSRDARTSVESFDFVTLASAISEVNGIVFSLATFLGKIPSIALEVLISYQIINIEDNKVDFIITIIVLIMIYFTLRKYKS